MKGIFDTGSQKIISRVMMESFLGRRGQLYHPLWVASETMQEMVERMGQSAAGFDFKI